MPKKKRAFLIRRKKNVLDVICLPRRFTLIPKGDGLIIRVGKKESEKHKGYRLYLAPTMKIAMDRCARER